MIYAIIKGSYVIDRIISETTPTYPFPHDLIMEDTIGYTHIGDWYEEAEGIFYRPINAIPPDVPDEIKPQNTEEE